MSAVVRVRVVLAIAVTVLCLAACGGDELDIRAVGWLDYGGRVERIETLGRYSSLEASLLVQLAGAPGTVATDHDYFLYRVIYSTTGIDGEPTRVSGLIAVPTTPSIKGVVSWQHGTNTYRPNSISKPSSPEGLGIAALFAADGFILAAADYIGLGVSTEMHPYYHYPTTVGAVVDLLSIAEIMLDGLARAPDHDLYIAGFSEGGGATAATQRALEQDNPTRLELRAAATVGAAFDPRGVSLRHVMQSDDAFHLGYLLTAFSRIYGQSLAGVVREPYADQLAGWYDGTKGQDYIDEHLPKRLDEFLTEAFLLDYEAGKENPKWFYDALALADTSDYAPRAPLRIHFGSADDIVIPQEARSAFTRMRQQGGNVELLDVGPYGHDDTPLQALPPIQRWFDALDGNAE